MCQVWLITDTPGAVSKKKSINVFRYVATATGLSTGVIKCYSIHNSYFNYENLQTM